MQCETRHFFSKEYFTNTWNQKQNKWKKEYLEQNISNHKLDGWDKKANTTRNENILQCETRHFFRKNSSQTVEIWKKEYLEQNISNHKLDG